ncbi:hypothetical protein [uncultured Thiothrix sp.]|uniref:hypothetical protein n=1 Tax=uncultured Thiothrix sp. TaxID=223185 RepID=UPI002610C21E|nr:hypothetical protein [uncultured Thiothrix sp.]
MQTPNIVTSEAPIESVNSSEILMNAMRRESVPDKNLDMIRNILFGEQIRELDRKHASLERFVRVSINTLAEDTQRKLDDLQHSLSLSNDLLREETKARRDETQAARQRLEQNERLLDDLSKRTAVAQTELHERMSNELSKLDQQMDAWRKDLVLQLQETAEQLRHEKADRKAVAGILNGMAKQLFDVEKIEAL